MTFIHIIPDSRTVFISIPTTDFGKRSLKFRAAKYYNKLPEDIKFELDDSEKYNKSVLRNYHRLNGSSRVAIYWEPHCKFWLIIAESAFLLCFSVVKFYLLTNARTRHSRRRLLSLLSRSGGRSGALSSLMNSLLLLLPSTLTDATSWFYSCTLIIKLNEFIILVDSATRFYSCTLSSLASILVLYQI